MISRWLPLVVLFFSSCNKEEATETVRPVKVIQAQAFSSNDSQIIFPGTLRAFKRADLSFRVDGLVIERNIYVGQQAKKDELLIKLDPREYEIALQKATSKVESAQAQLDFASRDYERMKKIYESDPGAISFNLLDRRKETIAQFKAELAIAKSDREKAMDDLSYTLLKAPFAGIIAAIYIENHEEVRAKQPIIRFLDTSEREMEIHVPEKYISFLLKEGDHLRFQVYLDAFPGNVFSAIIKEIGTEALTTTQTYPVTLALEDIPTDLSLLAGMSGNALLQKSSSNANSIVFKLPKSALFTENLETIYVWVVDPTSHTVHKKAVRLENNNKDDFAIIREGIATGDWIITAGTSFLSEGQKVLFAAEPSKP